VRRRFVDGGYFENSGITSVIDVIATIRALAAAHRVQLVVIRIENSKATTNPGTRRGHAEEPPYSGFGELWSPIRSMLATRQARGELAAVSLGRLSEQAGEACRRNETAARSGGSGGTGPADRAEPCVPISQVVFELQRGNVHIPLGWWLSSSAHTDMERQLSEPGTMRQLDQIGALLRTARQP
jgi:hypothetical protein